MNITVCYAANFPDRCLRLITNMPQLARRSRRHRRLRLPCMPLCAILFQFQLVGVARGNMLPRLCRLFRRSRTVRIRDAGMKHAEFIHFRVVAEESRLVYHRPNLLSLSIPNAHPVVSAANCCLIRETPHFRQTGKCRKQRRYRDFGRHPFSRTSTSEA